MHYEEGYQEALKTAIGLARIGRADHDKGSEAWYALLKLEGKLRDKLNASTGQQVVRVGR
jgi:hypothetical protein